MLISMIALLILQEPLQTCDPAEKYVCRVDRQAYEYALQECRIMARERRVYHAMGTAPRARVSGVGRSTGIRPRHCYSDLPEAKLLARAYVVNDDGFRYWSAHYE